MEFFLTFIVIVFLAGLILSRILPWLVRLWLRRMQKRYGMDAGADFSDRRQPEGKMKVNGNRQKKRIDESAGEYVDYEELDET